MPMLIRPSYEDPNQSLLILNLKNLASVVGYFALVWLQIFMIPWVLAWQPRKAIEVSIRGVQLGRSLHRIWVVAEGQGTWVRISGSRKKLATALGLENPAQVGTTGT